MNRRSGGLRNPSRSTRVFQVVVATALVIFAAVLNLSAILRLIILGTGSGRGEIEIGAVLLLFIAVARLVLTVRRQAAYPPPEPREHLTDYQPPTVPQWGPLDTTRMKRVDERAADARGEPPDDVPWELNDRGQSSP